MIYFVAGFVIGGMCGVLITAMLSINRNYPTKVEEDVDV